MYKKHCKKIGVPIFCTKIINFIWDFLGHATEKRLKIFSMGKMWVTFLGFPSLFMGCASNFWNSRMLIFISVDKVADTLYLCFFLGHRVNGVKPGAFNM